MKNFYSFQVKLLSLAFCLLLANEIRSQCAVCSATTFTVNLSSKADTAWVLNATPRSGTCCTGSNCIKFVVLLNSGSDLLSFNVTNPAPSGSAFYQINCGSSVSIGQPACISGSGSSICITYCKPGGDSPDYHITASKTVKASNDFTVRVGCAQTMTVGGLSASTITWTSISPGTVGQYNSYLSCSSGCSSVSLNPTSTTPTLIAYKVSGSPLSGCPGINSDTILVSVVPGMTTAISPLNPVVCSGGSSVTTLTATASGGQSPYTYTWSTSANTQTVSATAGNYTVLINDNTSGCAAITKTITVAAIATPTAPTASSNGPLCAGQTLNLAASSAGVTYNWTGPGSFTSAIQNPSVALSTTASSGIYSVTSTFSGCTGPAGTVSVTIFNAPATPTPGSNTPVCQGQNLVLSTGSISGATYNWNGPNGFTSTAQNPTVTGATTLAAGVYSLFVTANGCSSQSATLGITVNPSPAAPTVAGTSTLCAGSNIILSASAGGGVYNWTGPNSFSSSAQNPTITSASTVAAGVYSVTATSGGCTSPPGTFSVNVYAIPSSPTLAYNSPLCTGQTLSLTASFINSASYTWTGPNSFTSLLQNPVLTNAGAAASGNYSVFVNVAGCGNSAAVLSVTINPTPSAPVAGNNSPLCAGSALMLTAGAGGTSYFWTGPNSFTSAAQNPTISSSSTLAAGIYSVTQSIGGCTSAPATVSVTVNPVPATPTITGAANLCAGQTLSLTALPGSATFSWNGPGSYSSASQTMLIPSITPSASGTYSVTRTVSGCVSPEGTINISVNPVPPSPTVTSNSPVCALQPLYLMAGSAGSSYAWTGPNSFTSAVQNPTIVNTSTASAGSYSVTQTISGCTSPLTVLSVTVNPAAPTPTVSNNSPKCLGQNIVFTQTAIAGATYSWSGPNGFVSSVQNPTITSATLGASGNYSLFATVNGCPGQTVTTNVLVTAPGTISAGSNATVCANNSNVTLSGISSTGSGTWTSSGTGIFSPNTLTGNYVPSAADINAGLLTLTLSSTNNGGCPVVSDSRTISFSPAPTANAGSNNTVCANNATVSLSGSVSIAGGGLWSSSGTGTFLPNNTALTASYVPSPADITSGSFTLTLTTTGNGNCNPVSNSRIITVSPAPVVIPGPNPQVVCKSNPNLQLNGSSTTGNGIWASSGTGTFSSNSILNPVYFASTADTTAGSTTLTLTSTNNGGCNAVSQTMTLIYVSTITVNAGVSHSICSNAGVSLNGVSTTSAGIWTSNGTGSFSPGPALLTTTYVPSQADINSGSVTLTLTTTNNGGCLPLSGSITVTIAPGPTASAGASQTVCANNAIAALNGSFTVAVGAIWKSSGSGTFTPNNTSMNVSYSASPADTAMGGVIITLSTTSNGNCPASTSTMNLHFSHSPFASAGPDIAVCKNNPVALLNGYSSTGSGSWTTTGSGTIAPNNTAMTLTYTPGVSDTTAGSVTFILSSLNNGGCNAVYDTVVITYSGLPVLTAGADQTVCANNASVALTGTSSTGAGTWSTTGTGSFSPNTIYGIYYPGASDISGGQITLTLTSANNGGCAAVSDQVSIAFSPAPAVNAGANQIVCANTSSVTLNGSYSVATGAAWSSTGNGTFTPNNISMNAAYIPSGTDLSAGNVTIILASTGNGNCLQESDSLTISFVPAPSVAAGQDIVLCTGMPYAALNGTSSAGSFTWSTLGAGTFSPSGSVINPFYIPGSSDNSSGTVAIILISGAAPCGMVSDTLMLSFGPKPSAAFSHSNSCAGKPTAFTDASVSTPTLPVIWRLWRFNNDTSASVNPFYVFPSAGKHTVSLLVRNAGCADSVTKSITINPTPVSSFTYNILGHDSVRFLQTAQIALGSIKKWDWDFGDASTSAQPNPYHVYKDSGLYIVSLTARSDSGCVSDFSDTIHITSRKKELAGIPAVPSGFTPNGDGNNDVLYVKGGPFSTLEFRVYNEWGNLLFQSGGQSAGWDGTFKQYPQPVGKYIWTVNGELTNGDKIKMAGEVILNR